MNKIINAFVFLQKNGILRFIRECYYQLINNYYEKHFNVNTKGQISIEDLKINHHESINYVPLSYRHTINILKNLSLDINKRVLLDYGCGKGRVITCAAAQPYKKVIGIKFSWLINIAQKNIEHMHHRKAKEIVLKQCDAQYFTVPSEVNIIYFYNPFISSLLEKVTKNIYSSFVKVPRKIFIIYFNNDHFDKIISNQSWLIKTYQSEVYPNISCGLYETTLRHQ
jgi:SAM-dependent methyltransferase